MQGWVHRVMPGQRPKASDNAATMVGGPRVGGQAEGGQGCLETANGASSSQHYSNIRDATRYARPCSA
eukprot:2956123-Alexandrium_andersonii.AAC.1